MTGTPALTWTCLLPQEVSYHSTFDAPWLRELLAGSGNTRGRVLILANESSSQIAGLEGYDGVVGVNSPCVSDRRLQAAGMRHIRRFAVLPDLRRPRWFIPLAGGELESRCAPAVSASSFRLYSAMKPLARAARFAIRSAVRFGVPGWYRDQIVIAHREPSPLEQALQPLFPGQRVHLALSAGSPPPTRNRKISIAVLNDAGTPLAFVKLPGGTPSSNHSVRHEAEVLVHLAGRTPRVRAPRLLFSGELGGSAVPFTVSKPVAGRMPGFALTEAHQRFLRSLRSHQRIRASESGLVRSLFERLEPLGNSGPHAEGARAVRDALPAVMRALGNVLLPSVIVHGDFSPWNLREIAGEIHAYDWESAELSGLPLIDETHHLLSVGYLIRHWTAAEAAGELDREAASGSSGLPQWTVTALQMIYLIDYILRLYGEGYDDKYPRAAWCRQTLQLVCGKIAGVKA